MRFIEQINSKHNTMIMKSPYYTLIIAHIIISYLVYLQIKNIYNMLQKITIAVQTKVNMNKINKY